MYRRGPAFVTMSRAAQTKPLLQEKSLIQSGEDGEIWKHPCSNYSEAGQDR